MEYRYKTQYPEGLREVLTPREAFRPFPRYEDEAAWSALPADVKDYLLSEANALLSKPVPEISASFYMKYSRTGERDYDAVYFSRRYNMLVLMFAECIERKGRFLDKLIDYIWALCEMTTWVISAHNWNGLSGGWTNSGDVPLGDIGDFVIDLFAAQTGEYLAWTAYIMRTPLDKITYLVCERIEYELERRILAPFYNRRDFFWVNTAMSNWHIWITSNCLAVVLLMETNPQKRALGVELALRYTEEYIAVIFDDGGNVEGPSYWGVSAGSLYAALCLFAQASGGRLDYFGDPKVKKAAAFLHDVHITGNQFFNFGYCPRFCSYFGDELYCFGELTGDEALMGLGAHIYGQRSAPFMHHHQASLTLRELFMSAGLRDSNLTPPYTGYCYYPNLQLMCAREHPGENRGLFLGAKGNHGVFCEHLDGGNFILYDDCEPVFLDLGNATYNRSLIDQELRFSHFMVQTINHNSVTVNGLGQQVRVAGLSASSSRDSDGVASISIDLSASYDERAGVRRLVRDISLDRRSGTVKLADCVECDQVADIRLSFMTNEPPTHGCGEFIVKGIRVSYDPSLFTAETAELEHNDPVLFNSWGEHLYRTILLARTNSLCSELTISRI